MHHVFCCTDQALALSPTGGIWEQSQVSYFSCLDRPVELDTAGGS